MDNSRRSTTIPNRLLKIFNTRPITVCPSSPLKNGTNGSSIMNASERYMEVNPCIVTLIHNGTKPRKKMRLLLNKRNSPSLDLALIAITQTSKARHCMGAKGSLPCLEHLFY